MLGDTVRYADEKGRDYRGTVVAEHVDRSVDLLVLMDEGVVKRTKVPHRSARIKPKQFSTGRNTLPVTLPAREPGEFWTE